MKTKRTKLSSKLPLKGVLTIIRRDAQTGQILDTWSKKNVITYGATEKLVQLLAPNAAFGATVQEESQIKSMRFGTANTTPNRSDTDLGAEAVVGGNPVRIELADADRVVGVSGTVEFVAVLGAGDGNGVTYREAALFTRGTNDDPLLTTGETMFNHQVFPDQVKTGAISLEFRWRVSFTV